MALLTCDEAFERSHDHRLKHIVKAEIRWTGGRLSTRISDSESHNEVAIELVTEGRKSWGLGQTLVTSKIDAIELHV